MTTDYKVQREKLLQDIINIEEEMFVAVNKNTDPAWCQNALKTFQQMRYMTHAVLGDDTLVSYLNDLTDAVSVGRNLVMEKYARMDNLILNSNESVRIVQIAAVESKWFNAMQKEYPHIVKPQTIFLNYAIAELETYSAETLELYFKDVLIAELADINLVKRRYEILYKRLGFKDLQEVEAIAQKKSTIN